MGILDILTPLLNRIHENLKFNLMNSAKKLGVSSIALTLYEYIGTTIATHLL